MGQGGGASLPPAAAAWHRSTAQTWRRDVAHHCSRKQCLLSLERIPSLFLFHRGSFGPKPALLLFQCIHVVMCVYVCMCFKHRGYFDGELKFERQKTSRCKRMASTAGGFTIYETVLSHVVMRGDDWVTHLSSSGPDRAWRWRVNKPHKLPCSIWLFLRI